MRPAAALPLLLSACILPSRAEQEMNAAGVTPEQNVTAWRSWPRANAKRFQSKGHGFLWVDVHVPAGSERAYAAAAAALNVTAPSGFRVVKAGYEAKTGGEPLGITVMVKMPAGYDPQNGDWYYAAMAVDARRAALQGKLDPCIACHDNAPGGHDHVFGVGSED